MNTTKPYTNRTVISAYAVPPAIARIVEWEEAVAMGQTLVEAMDEYRWALGALAYHVRSSTKLGGRPAAESNRDRTLTALADAIGIRRERLSGYCAMFEFYNPVQDSIPDNATWDTLSDCRRSSGIERGEEVQPVHRERAIKLVAQAVDKTAPRPRRTLRDVIGTERDRLSAIAAREDAAGVADYLSEAVGQLAAADKILKRLE